MHIIGELMNAGGGMKAAHVPYRGFGPAMNDLLGDHIQFMSADLPVLEPMVKGGKVRALALFATERSPLLPDVPTSVELGYPGMIMGNWYGMLAPAGTPASVQAELEKAMMEAMKTERRLPRRLAAIDGRRCCGRTATGRSLARMRASASRSCSKRRCS